MEDITNYLNTDHTLKNAILFMVNINNDYEKEQYIPFLKNLINKYLSEECEIYEIEENESIKITITFKNYSDEFNTADAAFSLVLVAIRIWVNKFYNNKKSINDKKSIDITPNCCVGKICINIYPSEIITSDFF